MLARTTGRSPKQAVPVEDATVAVCEHFLICPRHEEHVAELLMLNRGAGEELIGKREVDRGEAEFIARLIQDEL